MKKKGWGFDTQDMDPSIRAQDDFFRHVTGTWMKQNEIPADESAWGSFIILRKSTETKLKNILAEFVKLKRVTKGTPEQLIRDFYHSGMDIATRNKLGARPLEPLLEKIDAITAKSDLIAFITELHLLGIGLPWAAVVAPDDKNSDVNIIHMYQSGLGMPDREYYLSDKPEQVRVRNAYTLHVANLFKLLGEDKNAAKKKAGIVLALETSLAKASTPKEDARNPDKVYHKMSVSQLRKIAPMIAWPTYFSTIGANNLRSLNVMHPKFMKEVNCLIEKTSITDWKTYLSWHIVLEAASYLSEEFVQTNFNFYGKVLSGAKEMKQLWRRTLAVVNGSLGEELGKIYVKEYFPPSAKRAMDELITNLFTAYRERIKQLDWMSAITKKRALKKLSMMVRKIGYPDKWKSYKGLEILANDYFGNILRSSRYEQRRNMRKLKKPVDRSEWHMYPQTVNAYYNPGTNEIAFPAAILQPPYFGPELDAGINYGAIGGVIGHEITHGFDHEGSKYDGKGNLHKWWTPKDRKHFERKAKVLEEQFNQYELHGVKVNGKLTLGENIADLGGYSIAFDAYKRHLAKTKTKIVDGFTPEQRFFLGMAQDWKEISRPESQKTMMLVDEHSPHEFRVNGPTSNLLEFYEAFSVKKGDKLYREPKDRAKIW